MCSHSPVSQLEFTSQTLADFVRQSQGAHSNNRAWRAPTPARTSLRHIGNRQKQTRIGSYDRPATTTSDTPDPRWGSLPLGPPKRARRTHRSRVLLVVQSVSGAAHNAYACFAVCATASATTKRPNRADLIGKINGWNEIRNALTIHYGESYIKELTDPAGGLTTRTGFHRTARRDDSRREFWAARRPWSPWQLYDGGAELIAVAWELPFGVDVRGMAEGPRYGSTPCVSWAPGMRQNLRPGLRHTSLLDTSLTPK